MDITEPFKSPCTDLFFRKQTSMLNIRELYKQHRGQDGFDTLTILNCLL